jgi:uncharacterized protein (DUF2235 family)
MESGMPGKNIVLCSDGTGNIDIKSRGTNVFKLYEAVDIQGHKIDPCLGPQVAFYDDGVGTSRFLPLRLVGGAFGWGFTRNVKTLYTELIHVYQPGDRLYLFGFSRGAYTVRALCGLIQYCGIVDLNRCGTDVLEDRVDECWRVFRKEAFKRATEQQRRRSKPSSQDDERERARRERLGAVIDDRYAPNGTIQIEFLGVWDTVGAVGAPFDELRDVLNWIYPMRFSELTPSCHIKRACHALSIDDQRRTFRPELWNEHNIVRTKVDQVWFAGVHSNIGGGYPKHGLSLVALDWMMAESEKCGLRFIPTDREYVRTHQDVHSKLYDSRAGLAMYYRWEPRDIAKLCRLHEAGRPKIHISLFERIANGTDGYAPGNIPFDCEVVATNGTIKWPSAGVLPKLGQLMEKLRPGHSRSASVHSPLNTVTRTIRSGNLSYYAFLAATVLALAWLYEPPQWLVYPFAIAGWDAPRQCFAVVVVILAGLAIMLWANRVDRRLEETYNKFWKAEREAVRKLLSS